ncbi:MAG: hypothetical protein ACFE9X_13670 [Promethearchaeota archaeon]
MYKNQKNYIKFLSAIILCTLIFTLTFQMNPGSIRKNQINNLRTSTEYDPTGIIALWAGPLNTIPAGWKLCDGTSGTINTTNLFVYSTDSAELPGSTGGSTSHNHTYNTVPYHDHGVTGTTSASHYHTYMRPNVYYTRGQPWPSIPYDGYSIYSTTTGTTATPHNHGGYTTYTGGTGLLYMSEQENLIPPYYELAFIEKETNDPVIPVGVIVMWAGDINNIPADWAICDGFHGTPDLRDRFIRGAPPGDDPGTLGGTVAHNHTYTEIPSHRHSIDSADASHNHDMDGGLARTVGALILNPTSYRITTGLTSSEDVVHTHSVPYVGQAICTTENTDNLPPYFEVAFIMNTVVTNALPMGVISMWGDSIANIPAGWNQCNGTNNTPDMLNRFPRGVTDGEQPGSVGGSATHQHIYREVPQHTHSIPTDPMTHAHTYNMRGSSQETAPGGIGTFCDVAPNWVLDTTHAGPAAHAHNLNPTGYATCYTSYANSIPPYVKLIYMQKIGAISDPTPEDGATDIIYSPILSVNVNDLEGDNLNVSFYNDATDALIGWDYIVGGVGTATVIWSGLSSGTTYSWYVKADDGLTVLQYDPWSFTTNYAPNAPTNPTPNHLATDINYSPTLSVSVFDIDGDDLTVSFYDASDDSIIDTDGVLGGTGDASVTWSGLSSGTTYSWYVISDDGLNTTQSATWAFTTNYAPNVPTNPTPNDGASNIGYNPTLSVDVFDNDGDDLTVSFYDASDDSLIDSIIITGGTGTASVDWSGLSPGTKYSWYVIADDGLSTTQSSTWTFTTSSPPGIPLPDLFMVGLIVLGTTGVLSVITYLRRKKWK